MEAAYSPPHLQHRGPTSLPADDDSEKGLAAPQPTEDLNGRNQGVSRIEALYLVFGKRKIYLLYASVMLIAYSASLALNTLPVYLPFATSALGFHSTLGTITVVTSVIGSVSKPFVAKAADMTSRPTAYLWSLLVYVAGLVILAASNSVNTVCAGQVLMAIGQTSLDMVTAIIVGDISNLQWRGLAQGVISSPNIINAFISGYITSGVTLSGWRWGFGMFAIILPVAMAPALFILFWGDMMARRLGAVAIVSPAYALQEASKAQSSESWSSKIWDTLLVIDAAGLVLLGFSWSLILLPFTLAPSANGGWNNPSMIAMEVVGWVLLAVFTSYELRWCPNPIMPKHLVNRTFILCCVIDVLYFLSFYIQATYYSSYVFVIKDWSTRDYTFYLNAATVAGCVFSLVAGVLQRYTHDYKRVQIAGVAIRALGMGLIYHGTGDNASDAVLVSAQIICAIGGALFVIATQVASQSSVPHSSLASAIAVISLWCGLGGSIGSAIGVGIASTEEIAAIYESIATARFSTPEVRAGVISAYDDVSKMHLYLPALILSVITIVPALFTSSYYLDERHNVVESKTVVLEEQMDEAEIARRAEEARKRAAARL